MRPHSLFNRNEIVPLLYKIPILGIVLKELDIGEMIWNWSIVFYLIFYKVRESVQGASNFSNSELYAEHNLLWEEDETSDIMYFMTSLQIIKYKHIMAWLVLDA